MALYNEYDPIDLQYSKKPLPWQPLESVLSVYLDMIERGKAVALHKSVQEVPPTFQVAQADGSLSKIYAFPPAQPQRDPATGAKRTGRVYNPWVIVPYTAKDLQDTLDAWAQLVQAIEERMPSPPPRVDAVHGLYEDSVLRDGGMLIDGFATRVFAGGRQPRFKYLAPGLRLPTADELISGPFRDLEDTDMPIKPIPILLANSTAQTPWFADHVDQIAAGLYLDGSEREGPSPFEDGSRLVLPYAIGGNGFAETCDGAGIDHRIGDSELYQIGWNPFILQHAVQLRSMLSRFHDYVVTGVWSVGEHGVTNPIERFQQADASEASWGNASHPGYMFKLGPGGGLW
jgi:hypothetical protein